MNTSSHPDFRSLLDKVDQLSNSITIQESLLYEDQILIEGLLDNLAKFASKVIYEPITTVRDAAHGAAVLYKAMRNPSYLETLTFLLKKYIKNSMKQIKSPQVLAYINRVFPTGRTAKDFLKALLLLPVVNTIKVTLTASKDQITDVLSNYLNSSLLHLEEYVSTLLSQGFGAITGILSALKLANVAFFDVLNMLNAKIKSMTTTNQASTSVNLAKPAMAEQINESSFIYKLNMTNYSIIE